MQRKRCFLIILRLIHMNSYTEHYIKKAGAFFPIIGKPEKDFLDQLSRSIEDYYSETGPDSTEAIASVFGPPQTAVKDYLAAADTRQIVRRVCVRKYFRVCVTALLVLCLMAAVLFSIHIALDFKALRQIDGYVIPVFTPDGRRIE